MVWYIKIINVCITVFILLRIQSPINASLQWAPSLILISAVLKSAIGTPVRLKLLPGRMVLLEQLTIWEWVTFRMIGRLAEAYSRLAQTLEIETIQKPFGGVLGTPSIKSLRSKKTNEYNISFISFPNESFNFVHFSWLLIKI